MNTPRTRAEFERNFHLLHQQIEVGKFHVAQGLSRSLDGLARVRFLPNGRLDFHSVDECARLEANSIANIIDGRFEDQLKEYQGPTEASAGTTESDGPPAGSDSPSDLFS